MMFRSLHSLVKKLRNSKHRTAQERRISYRPQVEGLEDRITPASFILSEAQSQNGISSYNNPPIENYIDLGNVQSGQRVTFTATLTSELNSEELPGLTMLSVTTPANPDFQLQKVDLVAADGTTTPLPDFTDVGNGLGWQIEGGQTAVFTIQFTRNSPGLDEGDLTVTGTPIGVETTHGTFGTGGVTLTMDTGNVPPIVTATAAAIPGQPLMYALNSMVNDPNPGTDPAGATYSWTQPEQIAGGGLHGGTIVTPIGILSDATIANPVYTPPVSPSGITTPGIYTLTVSYTDSLGYYSNPAAVTVIPGLAKVVVTPTANAANPGQPVTYTAEGYADDPATGLVDLGDVTPYTTFSINSGDSFNGNNTLKPIRAGNWTVTGTVHTDSVPADDVAGAVPLTVFGPTLPGTSSQTIDEGAGMPPIIASYAGALPLTYLLDNPGSLPAGINLNPDGTFSGVAGNQSAGFLPYVALISVNDGFGNSSTTDLNIKVLDITPPTFTSALTNTIQTISVGADLAPLAATDTDGDHYHFVVTSGSLPSGITGLNPDDGTFGGTADSLSGGKSYSAVISVSDGFNTSYTTLIVKVNPRLARVVVTSTADASGDAVNPGQRVTYSAEGFGDDPVTGMLTFDLGDVTPQTTFMINSSDSFKNTNVLTPTKAGNWTVTGTVHTDSVPADDVAGTVPLTVYGPTLPGISNRTINEGAGMSPVVPSYLGNLPLTYNLISGSLPPAAPGSVPQGTPTIMLNSDGSFTGVAGNQSAGTYFTVIRVSDAFGNSSTTALNITVLDITTPTFTSPVSNTTINVGDSLPPLAANDADGDDLTFLVTSGSLPSGIIGLNPDGSFRGKANSVSGGKSYSAVISVSDGFTTSSTILIITVNPLPPPITFDDADGRIAGMVASHKLSANTAKGFISGLDIAQKSYQAHDLLRGNTKMLSLQGSAAILARSHTITPDVASQLENIFGSLQKSVMDASNPDLASLFDPFVNSATTAAAAGQINDMLQADLLETELILQAQAVTNQDYTAARVIGMAINLQIKAQYSGDLEQTLLNLEAEILAGLPEA